MTGGLDQQRGARTWRGALRRVFDVDGPWLWLVYLPLYFITWFWQAPGAREVLAAGIGLGLFLPIYLIGSAASGRRLLTAATAVLLISFALIPFGGNWTVLAVYASAMVGGLRPARRAAAVLAGFALLTTFIALLLAVPWFYWLLGALLAAMIGVGNISHEALKDKNAALHAAQDEVRVLSRTAERERIARDLHDLLGRTLTLVAIKAEFAVRLAPRDAAAAEREMRDVADAARNGLVEVRAAVAGMTGASLAREVEASRAALAAAGIDCRVEGDPATVPADVGAVLAMALREAVTNVIRHAEARLCRIELGAGGGDVRLAVVDDGRGGSFREGAGLAGMRARLKAAGGMLTLDRAGGGTRLVAALPGPGA